MIERSGKGDAWMDRRRNLATVALYKDKQLTRRTLGIRERMKRYVEQVQPVLAFGLEMPPLSKTWLTRIRQNEGNYLRKLHTCKEWKGETMQQFTRRTTTSARNLFVREGHSLNAEVVLKR